MAVYDRELLNLTVDVDNSAVEMEVFRITAMSQGHEASRAGQVACSADSAIVLRSARTAAPSRRRARPSRIRLTGPMMMNYIVFHRHRKTRRLSQPGPPSAIRVVNVLAIRR